MSLVNVFAQTNFEDLTLDEALAKAKSENKMVFLDAYTSWCGPCAFMANTIFPQKEMGDFMTPLFVCVKKDMEEGEGVEIAKRYGISAYPTFLLLTPDGKVRHKLVGGSETAAKFIERVKRGLNEETALGVLEAKYQTGDRAPDFLASYVWALAEVGDPRAVSVADSLIADLSDGQRVDSAYWFVYADGTLSPTGSPRVDYLLRNVERFQKSVGVDRVATVLDRLLVEILSGKNGHPSVEMIDAIERGIGPCDAQSKSRMKRAIEIARAKLSGSVEKLLAACEKNCLAVDSHYLSLFYFPVASQIARQGTEEQRERLLELSEQLLKESTDPWFASALQQFIPYVLER